MSDETATGAETATSADFVSLSDIRIAHLELMRIASSNQAVDPQMSRSDQVGVGTTDANADNTVPDAQTIREFLAKAKRAGSTIAGVSDRRAGQRILDYWSAELVTRPGITSADVSPARLAPFAGGGSLGTAEPIAVAVGEEAASRDITDSGEIAIAVPESVAVATKDSAVSGDGFASDDELSSDELTERFRIRVAAQARQWKNTGYAGYLLRGEALKEAAELPQGPDIAEFVEASAKAETERKSHERRKTVLTLVFAALGIILAAVTCFAYLQRNAAVDARSIADKALAQAEESAKSLEALNIALGDALKETKSAREQAEAAFDVARKSVDDAAKRLAEQQAMQGTLRSATVLVIKQLKLGKMAIDELPPSLRQAVLVELAGQVKSGEVGLAQLPAPLQSALEPLLGKVTDTLPSGLTGYKTDFIQATIGLPRLTGDLASDVSTSPLAYINYSLVMGRSHRMAIYSAVNLDRSQRVSLQITGGSGLRYDVRQPTSEQPDLNWYLGQDRSWRPARLASANDIAWGPEFAGDPVAAALKLAQYTRILPNTMPQARALYGNLWAPLENWVRSQHNPLANRVTIFSGPVFRPADQPIDGVPVPYAYWKLAVSALPAAVKGEARDPEFVVDAFLVPRDAAGAFNVEQYRLPVAELEKRTSLNFGTLIEWTDSLKNAGPNGTAADDLAKRVKLLDSGNDAQQVRDELSAVLNNPDLPVPERRKIVAALVEMAALGNMTGLTSAGRDNVLQGLLGVPTELWSRPDWLPVFAGARRAVADLVISATEGQVIIGAQDRDALNTLKDRLGIQASKQTVYVQFAGMTREDAQVLSAKMRTLGWGIPKPGEERVSAAAGKNEVRYNPDVDADHRAAELLAADLTAAGQAVTIRAVPVIGANTLEIWISI
ncbi:DNA/RNA non-specific endonuclease [Mesorhizobium neociceri]|uniref:DNA/RNA non-specific endonuclease n=1 Tax=Mesorhizobium neociceri TaxID=1307853 RepID=A0A838B0B9_9HYPH|nr:DNA/RNA non-specific endonuclease [Mesorhizobium neociceri]MBA1140278.1 DNA/RNA non-specific endonuclease [Mesorhizobium neociceri]